MVLALLRVILPTLAPILLGMLLRRKRALTETAIAGMKTFVMRFGIPCLLFRTYLDCSFDGAVLAGMAAVLALTLGLAALGFRLRKTALFGYHSLPMALAEIEGSLAVPLMTILFGAGQAFRIASLDLAQTLIGVPLVAVLYANGTERVTVKSFLRGIVSVPFAPAVALGLLLNLTGLRDALGSGMELITGVTDTIAAPVSTLLLLCVGYECRFAAAYRRPVLRLLGLQWALRAAFCAVVQGVLCLLPAVPAEARWAVLLFSFLPPSFLAVNLCRTERESAVAAGACSAAMIGTLAVFCIIAAV